MRARKCDRCGNYFEEPSNGRSGSVCRISDLDTDAILNQEGGVSQLEIIMNFSLIKANLTFVKTVQKNWLNFCKMEREDRICLIFF